MIVLDTHIWYWWGSSFLCRCANGFSKALDGFRIELLALTPAIASRAVELTDRHRDPFDRMIIATSLELDGQLASADRQFHAYPELAGRLLA